MWRASSGWWVTTSSVASCSARMRATRSSISAAQRRAEGGEGLVEQEQRPGAQERAGERHPLALAAGELAGAAGAEAVEADGGERGVHALPAGAVEAEVGAQAEADVLGGGEVGEEVVLLEEQGDRALGRGERREVAVLPEHAAPRPG